MTIIPASRSNIAKAANTIKKGGLVAFPTETVYGLGANGFDPIAVAKIFEVKRRPAFNPLILHVSDKRMLRRISNYKNDLLELLIKKFWPGPLTVVIPKNKIVPEIVTAGNPTVAVRMPDHKIALELIEKCGVPIAAPSANDFGKLSPTTAEHVEKQLKGKVDLILDGGRCSVGVESTIIKIDDDGIQLLRPGGMPVESIEEYTGKLRRKGGSTDKPLSPGRLPFHYAPNIPIAFLNKKEIGNHERKRLGAIFFKENKNINANFASVKILTPNGDMREAATNLFSFLHELENENLDLILVEKIEETGLGVAIMDRLKKAVKRYSCL